MNYSSPQNNLRKYRPATLLDSLVSRKWRWIMRETFASLTVLLFAWYVLFPSHAGIYLATIQGLALISLAITIILACFEAYYYDQYFDDLPVTFLEPMFGSTERSGTYLTAETIRVIGNKDIVSGLLYSNPGKLLALRLDIPKEEVKTFIKNKKEKITLDDLEIETGENESLFASFVGAIYKKDTEFKDFIFQYATKEKELIGTARWITKQYEREKREGRWWGRDGLSKIKGIGKDWSYGQAFSLEKYARKIEDVYDFSSHGLGRHKKEVEEIEDILSRKNEANIILISDDDLQKTDIVVEFAKRVLSGKIPYLRDKVILILDINDVIVGKKSKTEFEQEIISMFNGAERAGNIILAITNLPGAMINSNALDSDILGLMGPYLDSPALPIITFSDIKNFHQYIENNLSAMEKFDTLMLKEDPEDSVIYNLEKRVTELEREYGVFFTYQSLLAIAENVSRYFVGQVVSDKTQNILSDLPRFARKNGRRTIERKDVLEIIGTKTGIPLGEIDAKEKDKLLNLEKILHERVISQNEAITAIGSTLRRARSGIEPTSKPLGSFLFLGPTGVGKTETAKALSQVFFNSDDKMIRLDMSEYSGPDALTQLLGSFETGKQGVLTSLLRENPYGVLLLDEFEKANHEIHNLFLQVLDEGIFSDMVGKKVNARNLIIIATSNAGSSIIWDYVKESKNLAENKENVVDQIIKQGFFRPELINRFDGVILFHPLSQSDLKQIAVLMLKKLNKRLENKSLELVINDELVDYLVEKGGDPVFGARPINRAIQDNVEEIIARKLIGENIKPGSKITITRAELESNQNTK